MTPLCDVLALSTRVRSQTGQDTIILETGSCISMADVVHLDSRLEHCSLHIHLTLLRMDPNNHKPNKQTHSGSRK